MDIDNTKENPIQQITAFYRRCKELKVRYKTIESKISKMDHKAFIQLISSGPNKPDEEKAFKLLKGYFIDKHYLCGEKIIYDFNAALGFGLGAGLERRVCIDPFGRNYQISSPYVSGHMLVKLVAILGYPKTHNNG